MTMKPYQESMTRAFGLLKYFLDFATLPKEDVIAILRILMVHFNISAEELK